MELAEAKPARTPPAILVAGITSLRLGVMETDNLGNFIIIEPLFRSLRARFPTSRIQTTLQLSTDLAARFDVDVLRGEPFWQYNLLHSVQMLGQVLAATLWRVCKVFGADVGFLRRLGVHQEAFAANDIVIDFSGDMYGENALNVHQFLMGTMSPVLARVLRKPTFSVASSPGPFHSLFKLILAKLAFRQFEFVSVRDPMSLEILNGIGLRGPKYYCRPCFSWGFSPTGAEDDEAIDESEPLLARTDKPIIGLILCNLNMHDLPPNKWPREDREYEPFLQLINYLVREKGVRVCVFSHRNKSDSKGEFAIGSDHGIVNHLLELIPAEISESVFTIRGIHSAATMNRIISRFEMLVSGRIHGAVQGIMQYTPTLIVDYGMEPKAHKLRGFALLCGLFDYICDPTNGEQMTRKAGEMWVNRAEISARLAERVPELVRSSHRVWDDVDAVWQSTPL